MAQDVDKTVEDVHKCTKKRIRLQRLSLQRSLRVQQRLIQRLNVCLGIVAGERDAHRAINDCRRQMHGVEHVAAVPLGAGGARRNTDAVRLQAVDNAL